MVYISVFQHTAHFQNHRNVQKNAVKLLPVSNKINLVREQRFYFITVNLSLHINSEEVWNST